MFREREIFCNLSLVQANVQTEFPSTRGSFNWNRDKAKTKPGKPGCSDSDNCDSSQLCLYDSDTSGLGTEGENSEAGSSEQRSVGRSVGALQEPPTPQCHLEPPTPLAAPVARQRQAEVHRDWLEEDRGKVKAERGRLHGERGRLVGELGRIGDRLDNMEEQLAKVGQPSTIKTLLVKKAGP